MVSKTKKSSGGRSIFVLAERSGGLVTRPPGPPDPDAGPEKEPAERSTRRVAQASGPSDIALICTHLQELQVERKSSIQMETAIVQRITARVVRALAPEEDDGSREKA